MGGGCPLSGTRPPTVDSHCCPDEPCHGESPAMGRGSPICQRTSGVCVSALRNDGTLIVPTFSKTTPLVASKFDDSGTEFDTEVNKARTKVADYATALRNR